MTWDLRRADCDGARPGQDRARVQSKAEWRWASEGWIHSRERQDTCVKTRTRRPQEGKKNVAVMAKELKNNFVIKGFLALFNMVAPPAEKKEENRF